MICDLAETYQILDYKRVPGRLLGTLVAGLGVNSRIYQKVAGHKVPTDTIMLSLIVDELRRLTYLMDGNKHKKQPESMTARLVEKAEAESDQLSFNSPEEFEAYRAALLGEINGD